VLYEEMNPPLKLQERDHQPHQDHVERSTSPSAGCRRTAASSSSSASGKEMDFRVSVLPTLFGEKIVMRLLDKGNLSST
jgi:type IV pilus assembly protein PilB